MKSLNYQNIATDEKANYKDKGGNVRARLAAICMFILFHNYNNCTIENN